MGWGGGWCAGQAGVEEGFDGESRAAQWFITTALDAHTPPRQQARSSPPPAVWQRAREWQGDTSSFFMCCSSTPLQSNREQHLCFTTTRQPLTGRRRGKPQLRSDIYDRLTSLCEYFYSFLHSVITTVFVFWSGVNVFRGHDGLKIKICIFISVPNFPLNFGIELNLKNIYITIIRN